MGLATGVTCPSIRYHPAIIAQAAATLAILSDGRFTLGVGSGERLNEHVVGQGWPNVRGRQEMLAEALDIINLLWRGGYRSYQGKYLQVEDARVFDLPATLPVIAVAAGGTDAAGLAATHGGGLFATEPRPDLVAAYQDKGGTGPKYAEIAMAWAPDVDSAAREAHRTFRWALSGWKVMTELPNPANFDAASRNVRVEDVQEKFACGPDPEPYLDAVKTYAEAGFDHLVAVNAGPDPDGFMDFFAEQIKPRS
ncbi:TIGR03557 family F420-dependent LLM class oxidoreductase [Actinoplanes regularis]|uniref:TIGR03557 family F420-dependent LLM class oxidoreductase n=1 Tax=Actinoplanes regularis TaxID=52697 RepID=UPI000B795FFD|nr:TIGR03557 family F420-dependent LLM class oxidoreductase [Actinoplanes regularis]